MLTGTQLEALHYEPETGVWIWISPPNHNGDLKGKVAGNVGADGYRKIRINGSLYVASRLAWLWMTGDWPENEIDHIDRDPSNDAWSNLREATSSQNKWNRGGEGLRGIYRSGSRWWAMAGRNNYLGTFDTVEEASRARDLAAAQMSEGFAILNERV
jgi:hypothetical protein